MADRLRTAQLIPPPPNEIVAGLSARRRRSRCLSISTAYPSANLDQEELDQRWVSAIVRIVR